MTERLSDGHRLSSEVAEILDRLDDIPGIEQTASEALQQAIVDRREQRKQRQKVIEYPYMPEEGKILYESQDNRFMRVARAYARFHSLDDVMPNSSVVVIDGDIVGIAANGSDYHENNECERVKLGSKTGEDYDKCEGCHPKNHSEPKAVADALSRIDGESLDGAELYLWGHWWCCEPCWNAMLSAGITTVLLLENSEVLFNKQEPGNIIGRQFEE